MEKESSPGLGIEFGGPEYARLREQILTSGGRAWRSACPGWLWSMLLVAGFGVTALCSWIAVHSSSEFLRLSLVLFGFLCVSPYVIFAGRELCSRGWIRWAEWRLRIGASNGASWSGAIVALEHDEAPAVIRGELARSLFAQPDFEVVSQEFVVETQDAWILCDSPFLVVLTGSPRLRQGWMRADLGTRVALRGTALADVTTVPSWLQRRQREALGRPRTLKRLVSSPTRPSLCLAATEEHFRDDVPTNGDPIAQYFREDGSSEADVSERRAPASGLLPQQAARFWATMDELRTLRQAMEKVGQRLLRPPHFRAVVVAVTMVPVAIFGSLVAPRMHEQPFSPLMIAMAPALWWAMLFSLLGEHCCFWLNERRATAKSAPPGALARQGIVVSTRNLDWPAVLLARQVGEALAHGFLHIVQPFAVTTESGVLVLDEPHLDIRVADGGLEDGCPGIAKAALLIRVGARVTVHADLVEEVPPPDWLRDWLRRFRGGYRDGATCTRLIGTAKRPIDVVVHLESALPVVEERARAESFRAPGASV